jgi:hypothetical protein
MSRFILPVVFMALFISSPSISEAYYTTAQEGFSVDGKTAVFVIDYAFGHENYDILMPLHAFTSKMENTDALTYKIETIDGDPATGKSYGIVLSDAKQENGMYRAPKGYRSTFRLLVLYTRGENEVGQSFRAHVTKLPFTFTGVRTLGLNESELEKYVTPYVTLDHGALIRVTGIKVNTR